MNALINNKIKLELKKNGCVLKLIIKIFGNFGENAYKNLQT